MDETSVLQLHFLKKKKKQQTITKAIEHKTIFMQEGVVCWHRPRCSRPQSLFEGES